MDRLPQRDADILHRVVVVDMQVALRRQGQIEQCMAGQQFQHVIEETDPGLDRDRTAPVEIQGQIDIGFGGAALDAKAARCLAHDAAL